MRQHSAHTPLSAFGFLILTMPKRDLPLKSIWEEGAVLKVIKEKHAIKMWHWMIWDPASNAMSSLSSIPFDKWLVSKDKVQAVTAGDFCISTSRVVETLHSARGDSTKLLIELQDGHRIETVIMKHAKHSTVCVSSQIGCKMGCRFCATVTLTFPLSLSLNLTQTLTLTLTGNHGHNWGLDERRDYRATRTCQ